MPTVQTSKVNKMAKDYSTGLYGQYAAPTTDPILLNALVKDSFIEAYKVSGVDVDPRAIIVPVNPRYAFITKIHKKLRKYSKRIGKRQALKWATFSGNKLFSMTN